MSEFYFYHLNTEPTLLSLLGRQFSTEEKAQVGQSDGLYSTLFLARISGADLVLRLFSRDINKCLFPRHDVRIKMGQYVNVNINSMLSVG